MKSLVLVLVACRGGGDAPSSDGGPPSPSGFSSVPSAPSASALFQVRDEPVPALGAGASPLRPANGVPDASDAGDGYVLFAREDGTIGVPRPVAAGWECHEKTVKGPAIGRMRMVECARRRASDFFFLLAKTYTVTRADAKARSAEQLANDEYRKDYENFFAKVTYTRRAPFTYRGHPGYEVAFDAVHATKGPVRKRERVVTVGAQVFLWSAEGSPESFVRFKRDSDAWMAGATFRELPEK